MKATILFFCLSFAAGLFAASALPNGGYHASKKSTIYHLPSCASAKNISKENLIVFASKEEARKKEYRPCLVCKP